MKHSNPIQLVVLVIALLLGYNAMQTIPYFFWLCYRWFSEGLTLQDTFQNLAINLLFIAFYFISAAILVKRSKTISERISEVAGVPVDASIAVDKTNILYVTLVAMSGYVLLTRVPKLLVKIYLLIEGRNNQFAYDGPNFIMPGESVPEFIIIITLSLILIAYAKPISKYLTGPADDIIAIDEIGSKTAEK